MWSSVPEIWLCFQEKGIRPVFRQSRFLSTCFSSDWWEFALCLCECQAFCASVHYLKSIIILLSCFREFATVSTSSANLGLDMQSVFSSPNLMPKPSSFQTPMSLRTESGRKLLDGSPGFFHDKSRIHVKTVARWSAYIFSKRQIDVLLIDRKILERSPELHHVVLNRKPSENRQTPPTCQFTTLLVWRNKSVRNMMIRGLELFLNRA